MTSNAVEHFERVGTVAMLKYNRTAGPGRCRLERLSVSWKQLCCMRTWQMRDESSAVSQDCNESTRAPLGDRTGGSGTGCAAAHRRAAPSIEPAEELPFRPPPPWLPAAALRRPLRTPSRPASHPWPLSCRPAHEHELHIAPPAATSDSLAAICCGR